MNRELWQVRQPLFRNKSRTLLKLGFVYAAQLSLFCFTLLRLLTSCLPFYYCHDWPHNIGYGLQLLVRFYGFKHDQSMRGLS